MYKRAAEFLTWRRAQASQRLWQQPRVGSKGHVVAADVSASMLNVAAEAARKAGMTNVETRVMNAENLELDADSFDAVVCRIALMLFPNPAQALAEMRRVVKPGGKVTVMVYAALEINPFWEIFHKDSSPLWVTYHRRRRTSPGCLALGEPGALEEVYRRGDFLNVSVRAVLIQRRLPVGRRRCWKHEKRCRRRMGDYEPAERGGS